MFLGFEKKKQTNKVLLSPGDTGGTAGVPGGPEFTVLCCTKVIKK